MPEPAAESVETTHYSIIDSEGTAVAVTYTLNGSYGAGVVADGTGRSAQVPGYPTAGKTGTARIPQPGPHLDPNDAYQDAQGGYHYESSFVGFVPGADLSIIVTIQDAETSIYGSEVAAPLFSRLAAMALRNEAIPPPSLVEVSSPAVPDLSPSARGIGAEGPVAGLTLADSGALALSLSVGRVYFFADD